MFNSCSHFTGAPVWWVDLSQQLNLHQLLAHSCVGPHFPINRIWERTGRAKARKNSWVKIKMVQEVN